MEPRDDRLAREAHGPRDDFNHADETIIDDDHDARIIDGMRPRDDMSYETVRSDDEARLNEERVYDPLEDRDEGRLEWDDAAGGRGEAGVEALGAGAGTLAGAAIGMAVGGPVGASLGGVIGAAAGAMTGEAAEGHEEAGAALGGAAGAVVGGAIGSVAGPAGAVVGGAVGAGAGAGLGDKSQETTDGPPAGRDRTARPDTMGWSGPAWSTDSIDSVDSEPPDRYGMGRSGPVDRPDPMDRDRPGRFERGDDR